MFLFLMAVTTTLVVSFLCSIFESVLLSVGFAQVEAMKGRRAGRLLAEFKRRPDTPIAAILILNTVAHTVGASVAGATYSEVFTSGRLWVFSAAFTLAVLVFTEIVPKTLGLVHRDRLAGIVALSVAVLVRLLKPLLLVTHGLSRLLRFGRMPPVTSLDEIRLLAALGRAEGVVGPRTAGIIEGAARLRDLQATHVIVHRKRVNWLSGERSLEENLRIVRDSGHSRFPFARGDELDEFEGIVMARDLLFAVRDLPRGPDGVADGALDWSSLVQPAIVVPETKSLHTLLQTFQEKRSHLAMVVDEFGGVDGIVTLEDILEELVGDILDESDHVPAREVVRLADGRLRCDGLVDPRQVLAALGVVARTETRTLGGHLADLLGTVPEQGAVIEQDGVRFHVLKASPRRAEVVEVERLPAE